MNGEHPSGWLKRWTDAPAAYDGFGTHTVEANLGRTSHGVVRAVLIACEHFDWQSARYSSGLYICLTLEQFQQFRSGEFPLISPLEASS